MRNTILILAATVMLCSCGVNIPPYQPSMHNYKALDILAENGAQAVSVGEVTTTFNDNGKATCRAGFLEAPDNAPFSHFLRNAIIEELTIADMYDKDAERSISASIQYIGLDSWGESSWQIIVDYTTSMGDTIHIDTVNAHGSSFTAYAACDELKTAFPNDMAAHLHKLFSSPEFQRLVTQE